ncbi:MAG TPA: class II aldolase/adducin family protein, partial [Bacillota bacterium]|nr:class II aldolase/adducin family protein [Bacillota bacterium]
GGIPLVPYGTPSTEEIPQAIAPFLQDYEAFLLENHGALTLGSDVYNAYYKMETMEHFATISLAARQLGGDRELSQQRVADLLKVRDKLGVKGRHPGMAGFRGKNE